MAKEKFVYRYKGQPQNELDSIDIYSSIKKVEERIDKDKDEGEDKGNTAEVFQLVEVGEVRLPEYHAKFFPIRENK